MCKEERAILEKYTLIRHGVAWDGTQTHTHTNQDGFPAS